MHRVDFEDPKSNRAPHARRPIFVHVNRSTMGGELGFPKPARFEMRGKGRRPRDGWKHHEGDDCSE
jgi:hypothetical protein